MWIFSPKSLSPKLEPEPIVIVYMLVSFCLSSIMGSLSISIVAIVISLLMQNCYRKKKSLLYVFGDFHTFGPFPERIVLFQVSGTVYDA